MGKDSLMAITRLYVMIGCKKEAFLLESDSLQPRKWKSISRVSADGVQRVIFSALTVLQSIELARKRDEVFAHHGKEG